MHHAALDGTGADDGDLDDQVLEAGRLQPGQHLRLSAALDLETADGVAFGQRACRRRDRPAGPAARCRRARAERIQVQFHAMAPLDRRADLGDHAQGAQAQQIDFDQPGILDAVLVPLRYYKTRLGRMLERNHLDQRLRGDEHPADMDGQVPRRVACLRDEGSQKLEA